jgi:hypothetical protein
MISKIKDLNPYTASKLRENVKQKRLLTFKKQNGKD